ncbi:hypothetical protein HW555_002481 [Spodoptera exigua]|uniref:RING-type domain-containing protein n=1 Tax=Spodoptera exigua TaxID=7107 RepID=A0A835LE77_SPOEX|nr:hypothetical protein HW555_002481 [Spodoptera exigua]
MEQDQRHDVIDLTNLTDSFSHPSSNQQQASSNADVIELDRDSDDSIFDRDLSSDGEYVDIYKNPKQRVAKLKATIKRKFREYDQRMERLEKLKREQIKQKEEKEKERLKKIKQTVREKCRAMRKKRDKCAVCNSIPKETTFGTCPICLDELGDEPMASTICGHVFCIDCIHKYLKHEPKCPTCRKDLKGSKVYHPLYLSQGT